MQSIMKYYQIILFVFLIHSAINAQYNGFDFSLSVGAVYTTSAEIYFNPNAVDPIIRNRSFEIDDILNPSLDIRFRLSEPLIIGINTEYMKTSQSGRNLAVLEGNNEIRLETKDGYILIPVELSLYYQMPFSTAHFKFLMGGGAGMYQGEFIRQFGDTEVSTLDRNATFGMHVSMSLEYLPFERLGLRFEMKFRDPEFKVKSRYNKDIVNYNGTEIRILRDTFDTKVNVSGVTFLLSTAFYF